MSYARAGTVKRERTVQVTLTSLQILGLCSTEQAADPAHGRVTALWSFELLQGFLMRKQLCSSVLLSS